MDIEEYARQSQLSRKILRWMVRKEMINTPLRETDILGLELLEKVWGRSEVLRAQLSKYSKARRLHLLTSPDFDTKWERYSYTRFCNLENGRRLPMKQLVSELEMTFNFILQRVHIKKLYKVRQKAYNRKKQWKKQELENLRNE